MLLVKARWPLSRHTAFGPALRRHRAHREPASTRARPFLGAKPDRRAKLGGMSAAAELTAVSSTLSELTRRVTRILSELSPADEERYAVDLAEVERALGVASRRLERLVSAGSAR